MVVKGSERKQLGLVDILLFLLEILEGLEFYVTLVCQTLEPVSSVHTAMTKGHLVGVLRPILPGVGVGGLLLCTHRMLSAGRRGDPYGPPLTWAGKTMESKRRRLIGGWVAPCGGEAQKSLMHFLLPVQGSDSFSGPLTAGTGLCVQAGQEAFFPFYR